MPLCRPLMACTVVAGVAQEPFSSLAEQINMSASGCALVCELDTHGLPFAGAVFEHIADLKYKKQQSTECQCLRDTAGVHAPPFKPTAAAGATAATTNRAVNDSDAQKPPGLLSNHIL